MTFLASGAVSGRGHWSHKARPSPSWAPPSFGRSPPPPDRYCCQTPHWGGVTESGRKWKKREGRGGCQGKKDEKAERKGEMSLKENGSEIWFRFWAKNTVFRAQNQLKSQKLSNSHKSGLVVTVALSYKIVCMSIFHIAYFVFIVISVFNLRWYSLIRIIYFICFLNKTVGTF